MIRIVHIAALLFTLIILMACSGDNETSSSADGVATLAPLGTTAAIIQPTSTTAPAPISAEATQPAPANPTETVASGDTAPAAPALAANALDQLTSYRSTIDWRVAQGDTTIQQVGMQIAEIANPPARHITMTSNQGDFAMIQIGDALWINAAGQWQQLPAASAGAMAGQMIFTPEELSSFAADSNTRYEFIGTETINGIRTNHYRLTLDPNNLPEGMATDEVRDLNAEIWVADEAALPSFAVRMHIDYTGTFEGSADSKVTLDWEVADINADFTIEPPN